MKIFHLLTLASLLLLPISNGWAASTEYYVDDATGDDADSGLTEALAWATLQYAFDNVVAPSADGEYSRINVKNTNTYVITANIDVDTVNGAIKRPIIVEGYSSTIGDGGVFYVDCDDGTPDASIGLDIDLDYYIWRGVRIDDATGDNWSFAGTSVYNFLVGCISNNAGDEGILMNHGSSGHRVIGCEINNAADIGAFNQSSYVAYLYNYIHDTGSIGLQTNVFDANTISGNIIDTTVDGGIRSDCQYDLIFGNTVYNTLGTTAENLRLNNTANSQASVVLNNIFNTATGHNIQGASATLTSIYVYGYNNLNGGTVGSKDATIFLDLGGENTSDPDFVDAANADFNLDTSTPLDNAGYPATYLGASSTAGNREMGAVPYEETGGGGTTGHAF